MFQLFVDREEELEVLENRYKSKKPEFIIIYGRRRVGKTELILQFTKNKPSIYFLAEEKQDWENLEEIRNITAEFLNDDEFRLIKFSNWVELFRSFSKRVKERVVVVIDEFPYLIKQNKTVPSEFQKIWDLYLSKSNIVLILVGSSIGMMERILGRKSPLYGRRTAQLEINPLEIWDIKKFLPSYSIDDLIRVYGCADGIPLYINCFSDGLPFWSNLRNNFLKRDSLLYMEAEILLRQEFREMTNYFSILKAISFGNTRHSEISNYANLDKTIVSKYIQNLERIRIIKREYPITEKKEKRKDARYRFIDNYFRFWFRFIYPNKMLIEKGEADRVIEIIKRDYDSYLGHIFEDIGREFLWKVKPFRFTKIGRWWHKDKEIDLVVLDEIEKQIAFFEVKWRDLRERQARKTLEKLREKSRAVKWGGVRREEHFGVIAKKIDSKEKLRKEGYIVFDLRDIKI